MVDSGTETKEIDMKEKMEYLDENLEEAYRQTEFDVLCDYFISVRQGKQVEDPRSKMSFMTKELEEKAKAYASCLCDVTEEFDGTMEKRR